MRKRMLLIGVPAAIAVCAVAAAAPSPALERGTVISSRHGTLLLASQNGVVRVVSGRNTVGTRVSLTNGRLVVVGHAHRAMFRGVVLRRIGNLTFLSAAKHVVVVRTERTVASARDSLPPVGSVVRSTVAFGDHGDLDEENEDAIGNERELEVQGIVSSIAAGSVTLTVNGQMLTIPLPAGTTLPASVVGTRVTVEIEFEDEDAEVAPATTTTVTTTTTTTTTPVVTPTRDGDRHGDDGDGHHGGRDGHD